MFNDHRTKTHIYIEYERFVMSYTTVSSSTRWVETFYPLPQGFWQYVSSDWIFWNIKFYTLLLHVHIYTKLFFLHFIQLSLTMTTLCHIKHGQLENFYISPEKKHEKLTYCWNGVTDRHKIWWWGTSLKFAAIKSFNFKNPRRQTATGLKIEKSWYLTGAEHLSSASASGIGDFYT